MQLLLATTNAHKLDEVREILDPLGIEVIGLDALPDSHDEPIEDSDTFEGNARLKAIGYARSTGVQCMADDSGLEVDALGGRPGVYSARYAGIGETRDERDNANNTLLLEELGGVQEEKRTARFVCAICVANPDGSIVCESKGFFEGRIGLAPKGSNGFGYDPLLFVPEANKTSAEMSSEEKNARSHRGEAIRKIISYFEQ